MGNILRLLHIFLRSVYYFPGSLSLYFELLALLHWSCAPIPHIGVDEANLTSKTGKYGIDLIPRHNGCLSIHARMQCQFGWFQFNSQRIGCISLLHNRNG